MTTLNFQRGGAEVRRKETHREFGVVLYERRRSEPTTKLTADPPSRAVKKYLNNFSNFSGFSPLLRVSALSFFSPEL